MRPFLKSLLLSSVFALITPALAAVTSPLSGTIGGGGQTQDAYADLIAAEGQVIAVGGTWTVEDGVILPIASTPVVLRSMDGRKWRPIPLRYRTAAPLTAITYGEGRFVAVGGETLLEEPEARRTHTVMYSDDGHTWTELQVEGLTHYFEDIAYLNGTFIAIDSDAFIWTSASGESWTQQQQLDVGFNAKLTAGGGTIIATGEGNAFHVTQDGLTWESYLIGGGDPSSWNVTALSYVRDNPGDPLNGNFVGIIRFDCCNGEVPDAIRHFSFRFAAGEIESVVLQPLTRNDLFIQDLAFFRDQYLGVGSNQIWRSADLITWTGSRFSSGLAFIEIEPLSNAVLVLAQDRILRSTTTRNWQRVWKSRAPKN